REGKRDHRCANVMVARLRGPYFYRRRQDGAESDTKQLKPVRARRDSRELESALRVRDGLPISPGRGLVGKQAHEDEGNRSAILLGPGDAAHYSSYRLCVC